MNIFKHSSSILFNLPSLRYNFAKRSFSAIRRQKGAAKFGVYQCRYLTTGNDSSEVYSATAAAKNYESLSTQKSKNVVAEKSFFDTHLFINSLISNGFEQRQAERMCELFKEIVNFVATDIKRDCVTKAGLDLAIQQIMIQIGSLKKDMIILEKSEFSALRNENEKLNIELKNLRDALNDEIVKLKGGFTLDINLEKNRSTEAGYDTNNKIQKLDSRIDSEVSNLKAMLEAFKADSIKFIAGSLFTVLVIILGALRYFTM